MNKRLQVIPIPALQDNYIWLVHFLNESECFVVDPGIARPVLEYTDRHQLILTAILTTHHHWDHTNGITELVKKFPSISVFGPANETITYKTHDVKEGDTCFLLKHRYQLSSYAVPGHTKGHIVYYSDYLKDQVVLFSGDTLFSAGCGRLLEGSADQLYHSLMRLKHLPEQTQIYCGHEYTVNNLMFGQWLEPDNIDISEALEEAQYKHSSYSTTLPSSIAKEKLINPFLRCDEAAFVERMRNRFAIKAYTPVSIFAFLRQLKDQWSSHEAPL